MSHHHVLNHARACSAMGGTTRFEDALAARLAIMAPSRKAVDAFVASHPPQYSPGKQAGGGGCTSARAA